MYRHERTAVLDIETTSDHKKIWMVGLYYPEHGTSMYTTNSEELGKALRDIDAIVGHNLLGFDLPVLEDVWGYTFNGTVIDTLVLGRLLNPSIEPVYRNVNGKAVSMGSHSLRAWAIRAGGELKEFFEDYDGGLTEDMIEYCLQDCRANWDVFLHIESLLERDGFSRRSADLEHFVREATTEQERNGFCFDFAHACDLHDSHKSRMSHIERELQVKFPPIVTERYSTKTGKRLKDHVEVFNVGSRQQVAKRLSSLGAKWTRTTPTGKPVVDEKSLEENAHVPEAALVLEYLTLQKRFGMVKSWLDNVDRDTGRMTHSKPNMAQIPSIAEYRQCFTVPDGHKLVGIDASGLELRMLAHYMNDPEYTDLILNGDIHTHNQHAAGLSERAQAKTFI